MRSRSIVYFFSWYLFKNCRNLSESLFDLAVTLANNNKQSDESGKKQLQTSSMAFSRVDAAAVYKTVGQPSPKEMKKLLQILLNENFAECSYRKLRFVQNYYYRIVLHRLL